MLENFGKSANEGFRLVTRSDFDGIVCAVILEELGKINDILFADPHDMQEGQLISLREILLLICLMLKGVPWHSITT